LEETAITLAAGKLESDVGKIDGANANGGFAEESYKAGVISGAKMGTEYESTQNIAGDKSPEGVAKFKHGSERFQQTRKDAIDNTLQKGVEVSGISPETADMAMLVGTGVLGGLGINNLVGNPAGKLWKKVDPLSHFRKDKTNAFDSKGKDGSANHQDNKANHAEENKVTHGNSSRTTNFAGQPNANHKVNNRSILSKMGENVKGGLKPTAAGAALFAAEMGLEYAAEHTNSPALKTASNVLNRAETVSWAATGAMLGSFIPGVGTVIGGAIGGVAGFAKDIYDGDVSAAFNALNQNYGPAGGSGQVPGSSGYVNANYKNDIGSTIVPAFNALNQNYGPAGGSGQVPGSSQYRSAAPAYAQNAFSTPSGFNTMSAMSGKTAFNDATNVANATPQSFKTDTSLSSLDSAKDISFGVEGTQDSIMDLQETMADLMKNVYGENKGEE